MRIHLLFFSAAFALLSCGSENNGTAKGGKTDSLLSTDLIHSPASGSGAANDNRELPVLSFSADTTHDFGTIREGEVVEYSFPFKNTGKAPLLITGASASCGCTVPDYPREPMEPGKDGTIRVSFNSKGKPGHQEKTVTVSSNTARGNQFLKITAEVTPAAE
jgi:hypothetical protein